MRTLLLTLLLLSNSVHAHYKDWDETDQLLWKSYVALNVIDTFQTFDLIDKQKDPNYRGTETNAILGSRPSKEQLIVLKIVVNSLAYKLIHDYPQHRTLTLGIMNGIYIRTVQNNHEVGLRVNFRF
mgnify:CR=1 FL=1